MAPMTQITPMRIAVAWTAFGAMAVVALTVHVARAIF
jgi:hypothetical protein